MYILDSRTRVLIIVLNSTAVDVNTSSCFGPLELYLVIIKLENSITGHEDNVVHVDVIARLVSTKSLSQLPEIRHVYSNLYREQFFFPFMLSLIEISFLFSFERKRKPTQDNYNKQTKSRVNCYYAMLVRC